MFSSEVGGMQKRLKCRVNLGVKALLPPSGGAAQQISIVSFIYTGKCLVL